MLGVLTSGELGLVLELEGVLVSRAQDMEKGKLSASGSSLVTRARAGSLGRRGERGGFSLLEGSITSL